LNVHPLIEKLIEIERALGSPDTILLRRLVIEAQNRALELQKEVIENHTADMHLPVSE